ncbi:MAG: DUF2384 domain-containing protein [Gemmatimonadaceae bacterium]|nr:DUF2384 domain-containing protein [Gemmatimonadaceae bacterium]
MSSRSAAADEPGCNPAEITPVVPRAAMRYLDPAYFTTPADSSWIASLAGSGTMVRMTVVREGLPAQIVPALAEALDLSRDELMRQLGLPRATVERKLRTAGALGQAESERLLGVATLVALAGRMVQESGDPAGFDAGRWTSHWLRTPAPALGGVPPMALMDTADGRAVVHQLLTQMQSGAYA